MLKMHHLQRILNKSVRSFYYTDYFIVYFFCRSQAQQHLNNVFLFRKYFWLECK